MNWFDIIKDFSETEIFDALGLNVVSGPNNTKRDFEYYSRGWEEEHKKVTLRTLNFMSGTSNVEWKYHPPNGYEDINIYGVVTVGDITIKTPSVSIDDIGDDVSELGECSATTVTKDGDTIRICIEPDYGVNNPWGDYLAAGVLFYHALLTQEIPMGQTQAHELVWLTSVAKDKTQYKGFMRDKWQYLRIAIMGWGGITDANWKRARRAMRELIKDGDGLQ